MAEAAPAVEVAHDAHGLRVRRPDAEARAVDALVRAVVGAEHLPQLLVAALGPQVEVDLADARNEAVGVVGQPVGPAVVGGAHGVGLALVEPARQEAVPESVGVMGERVLGAVGAHDRDARGERAHDAHEPAALDVPLPERLVRLRVAALDERAAVVGVQRGRADRLGSDIDRGVAARSGCRRAGGTLLLGRHHVPFG